MNRLPRFVVIQHTFAEQCAILLNRLEERRAIPPLAPFCQPGECGIFHDIPIACYTGPALEMTLVPILEQKKVEYVFSMGLAGSLSEHLRRGDLIAPIASVRGDGLSDYWADAKLPAVANASVLVALNDSARRLGVPIANGVFYSTQTMYKETNFLPKWSEMGVVAVEMEMAQHLILAQLHGKKAGGLYVISDHPLEGDAIWETGIAQDRTLMNAYGSAVDILLDAIRLIAKTKGQ